MNVYLYTCLPAAAGLLMLCDRHSCGSTGARRSYIDWRPLGTSWSSQRCACIARRSSAPLLHTLLTPPPPLGYATFYNTLWAWFGSPAPPPPDVSTGDTPGANKHCCSSGVSIFMHSLVRRFSMHCLRYKSWYCFNNTPPRELSSVSVQLGITRSWRFVINWTARATRSRMAACVLGNS